MRVLLDTNVLLDVLLRRGQWVAEADAIWQANTAQRLTACVTASSLTDVYYISRRLISEPVAQSAVRQCLDHLELLAVDREVLEEAYGLAAADFEDGVQIASAVRNALDAIITRDPSGFADSPIEVLSPTELATRLQSEA